MATLGITGTSVRAALGTVQGSRVLLYNYGPSDIYALGGTGSASAAGPTGTRVAAGCSSQLYISSAMTDIAAICSGVSGTATLQYESPGLGPAGPFVGPTGPSGGPTGSAGATGPTGPTGP